MARPALARRHQGTRPSARRRAAQLSTRGLEREVNRDKVPVLVYTGSYLSALSLRSVLDAKGIRSSFEDLPMSPAGDSRIYVALADVPRAMPLVEEFRTNTKSA